MELHSVFQEPTTGNKLVVGVLFEISKKSNPFLQTLIDAGLPKKNGDTKVTSTLINLADVLTSTSSYFTYSGSLTTPPCSENVTWIVLAKPANVSQAQFQSFRRILGNDFRPLQNLNGRVLRSTRDLPSRKDGEDN
jgi:carbonic anhydrase